MTSSCPRVRDSRRQSEDEEDGPLHPHTHAGLILSISAALSLALSSSPLVDLSGFGLPLKENLGT